MNPLGNIKHGQHGSRTYARWKAMRQRTSQQASAHHRHYYANVGCCERWASYESFLADMGECPAGHTLDRIDNNKGYEPGNCRWITQAEQNANRSNVVTLTHNGLSMSVADWARQLGVSANALRMRLRLGWSHERTLTTPIKGRAK